MNQDRPLIHTFHTSGGYYIFDVNTNTIIRTRKSIYDLLNKNVTCINSNKTSETSSSDDMDQIQKMKSAGFLSSNRIKHIVHPRDETLEYDLENNLNMLTLQVTQECNLRCGYCSFSGKYSNRQHSDRSMSIEMARKGIDFLVKHSSDMEKVHIGFYGGEPLLKFEFIKKCVEYAKEKCEGKKVTFGLTSNGTIINDSIIEYFIKHNFQLMISLDGPKEIHDKNRRFAANNNGTFDTVFKNVLYIKENYPEYGEKLTFNMVLDPEADFSCVNQFVMDSTILSDSLSRASLVEETYSINTANNINENYIVNRGYERFKLFLSKLKRLDSKNTSRILLLEYNSMKDKMVIDNSITKELPSKSHHSGPCVPGGGRLFMNVHGAFYPCEKTSEESDVMKIGDINSGFDIKKIRNILNIGKLTEESCKDCWATNFCSICAIAADDLTCFSAKKKSIRCGIQKFNTEEMFKDYCVLKEMGHDFDDYDHFLPQNSDLEVQV